MGFTGDFLHPRNRRPAKGPLIVRVDNEHRHKLAEHLLALNEDDRYLRFGYHTYDDRIRQYVSSIDLDYDDVFAVLDDDLQIIAAAHVAYTRDMRFNQAEFGVSVAALHRGHGLGQALMQRSIVHARAREVDMFYIHALAENHAMLSLARKAGMRIESEGDEVTGRLILPPSDFTNTLTDVLADRRSEEELQRRRRIRWWRHLTGTHRANATLSVG
jgi:RimJ/RimL family protein N-acetyltransferase